MDVYVCQCQVRNPFRVVKLPLLARAYRFRKGIRRSLAQKLVRALTPSDLYVKAVVALAGQRTRGTFAYRRDNDERQISFRVANTQYHALYFPQFAGGYESETTCLVDILLAWNPGSVVFDIGSNWGFYSLFAASSPGFAGSVHAFEPFPASFADLADMVRQAGLEGVIECHELALASAAGCGVMSTHDGATSGTAQVSRMPRGVSMRMAALDSLDLPRPDILKVDVEGFEAEVFAGGARIIEDAHPMIIFESWQDAGQPEKVLRPYRILAARGYRFFQVAELFGEGPHCHLAGYRDGPPSDMRRGIGLVEFAPEQRLLLARYFNVFACHESRCEEFLASNFERLGESASRPVLRVAC